MHNSWWQKITQHPLFNKSIVLIIGAIILWFLKPMFNLLIMTLFLTILVDQLARLFNRYAKIPRLATIIGIYGSLIGGITYLLTRYWHSGLIHLQKGFTALLTVYMAKPNAQINSFNTGIIPADTQYKLLHLLQKFHIDQQLAGIPKIIIQHIPTITQFGIDIVIAIGLSFIIVVELPTLHRFTNNFYTSHLSDFFKQLFNLTHDFIQAFTIAIDTQLIISIANTIITTIGLWWLGYDNLWMLAIMVWVLSLIPVVGALLSFIPLAIIGFAHGGIYDVIMVGLLLIGVHAFESYVLNPQLMANRTKLPIAYTFIALILGDTYLGVWGLLLAVPLATFAFDFLGIQSLPTKKSKSTDISPSHK